MSKLPLIARANALFASPPGRALVLFARVALAAVFFFAAVPKISDPQAFAEAIDNYEVLPDAVVGVVAASLPVLELLVALSLVTGVYARGAGLAAAGMLLVFVIGMAQAIARNINVECGCFGSAMRADVGWGSIARNVGLLSAGLVIAFAPDVSWWTPSSRGTAKKRAVSAALAVLLALGAAASTARASLVEALDLAKLVASADHIAVVHVDETQARWDDRGRIVTDCALRIEERMKGPSRVGEVLVATRLGGAIGELGMTVPGEATFAEGERLLVFLEADGAGGLRAVGMSQGVMPVRAARGGDVVLPGGAGLALVQPMPTGRFSPGSPALLRPTPLRDVRAQITDALEQHDAP